MTHYLIFVFSKLSRLSKEVAGGNWITDEKIALVSHGGDLVVMEWDLLTNTVTEKRSCISGIEFGRTVSIAPSFWRYCHKPVLGIFSATYMTM